MKKAMLSLALIATLSSTLFADSEKYELEALMNMEYTDSDSPLKDHIKSYSIRGNYKILENILIGLEYNRGDNQKYKSSQKTDLQRYFLNAFYEVDTKEYIPYAFIGAGYQDIQKELFNLNDGFIAQAGVGFKYKVVEFLKLFIEGKVQQDFKNDYTNFAIAAGFSIPFGYENTTKEPTVSDSDQDGVADDIDICPNTPYGVAVDAKGCPLDSDKDGVADNFDMCPNTPYGAKVDLKGCEIEKDSDGDGVNDKLDKCPNTPKGVAVDKNGCPIVFNLDINFDFNSAKIKAKYLPKIKEVAQFLKAHPAYKADIKGYTDNIGSKAYNKKLSLKRAKAVYEALISMGIDANRLTYMGYGEENPIAPNTTAQGRAKNRRVEVHILY